MFPSSKVSENAAFNLVAQPAPFFYNLSRNFCHFNLNTTQRKDLFHVFSAFHDFVFLYLHFHTFRLILSRQVGHYIHCLREIGYLSGCPFSLVISLNDWKCHKYSSSKDAIGIRAKLSGGSVIFWNSLSSTAFQETAGNPYNNKRGRSAYTDFLIFILLESDSSLHQYTHCDCHCYICGQ